MNTLQSITDSPLRMEDYYLTKLIGGRVMEIDELIQLLHADYKRPDYGRCGANSNGYRLFPEGWCRCMRFETKEQKLLGETLYKGVHESGLTVYVLPKKEHCKSYAAFAASYGSTDDRFIAPGDTEITTVPDGVAHFLEHKLFEQPDGSDAFASYGKTGANANAFTSFTVYRLSLFLYGPVL